MKAFLVYKNPPIGEENDFHSFVIVADSFEEAADKCGGRYEKDPITSWDELHFPREIFRHYTEDEKREAFAGHKEMLAIPWFGDLVRATVGPTEVAAAKIEGTRVYDKGPLHLVLVREDKEEEVLYLRELPVIQ